MIRVATISTTRTIYLTTNYTCHLISQQYNMYRALYCMIINKKYQKYIIIKNREKN